MIPPSESDIARGVVVLWKAEEGWGLIESPSLDGIVWTHFSVVEMTGYRALTVGERVYFTWDQFPQDGYRYRAVRVTRAAGG